MDDFQVIGLLKVAATNEEIASNMATIFGSHGQQDLNLNGNWDKLAPQKSRKHLQGQPYPARYFVSLSSALSKSSHHYNMPLFVWKVH